MKCKHYADLYGRCIDCGATWEERKPKTWECANCDHATDNRELAAQHLTECEGVGEYPDELDPEPWRDPRTGFRYAESNVRCYFNPRPGYVQDYNAYGA